MARSWKNTMGVGMGGLLVDTLTNRFLSNNKEYDNASLSCFDKLCCDFFEYLKDEPKKDHYQALGSGQDVKVKRAFQNKAKKAYNKAINAINENNEKKKHDAWREIFGRQFPKAVEAVAENRTFSAEYTDNEEFIEDKYPVDIQYGLKLDCEVARNGFRESLLSKILAEGHRIGKIRSLDFCFNTDVPEPYEVKWKARNTGSEAKRRNCKIGRASCRERVYGLV